MAHWLLPANTKLYEVIEVFNQSSTYWPMKAKQEVRNVIYIYLAAPQKQIPYTCEVVQVGLSLERAYTSICNYAKDSIDDKKSRKPFTTLSNIVKLSLDAQSFLSYQYLKEHSLNGMLIGPRKLENSLPLLKYIQERLA